MRKKGSGGKRKLTRRIRVGVVAFESYAWRELDNYAPIPKDWFVKARAGPELVH